MKPKIAIEKADFQVEWHSYFGDVYRNNIVGILELLEFQQKYCQSTLNYVGYICQH